MILTNIKVTILASRFSITLAVLNILAFQAKAQSDYNDLQKAGQILIFQESFDSKNEEWINSDVYSKFKFSKGSFIKSSKAAATQSIAVYKNKIQPSSPNWQMEILVKFLKGEEGFKKTYLGNLDYGCSSIQLVYQNNRRYGQKNPKFTKFNNYNSLLKVGIKSSGHLEYNDHTEINKNYSISNYNSDNYNLLTLRQVDGVLHIFVNKEHIISKGLKVDPDQIGLGSPSFGSSQFDNLTVSEITQDFTNRTPSTVQINRLDHVIPILLEPGLEYWSDDYLFEQMEWIFSNYQNDPMCYNWMLYFQKFQEYLEIDYAEVGEYKLEPHEESLRDGYFKNDPEALFLIRHLDYKVKDRGPFGNLQQKEFLFKKWSEAAKKTQLDHIRLLVASTSFELAIINFQQQLNNSESPYYFGYTTAIEMSDIEEYLADVELLPEVRDFYLGGSLLIKIFNQKPGNSELETKRAIDIFKTLLEKGISNSAYHLAYLYNYLNDPATALNYFGMVKDPNLEINPIVEADIRKRLGDTDSYIKLLESVLESDNLTDRQLANQLLGSYYAANNLEKAYKYLQDGCGLGKRLACLDLLLLKHPPSILEIAKMYDNNKRQELAMQWYKYYIELSSVNSWEKKAAQQRYNWNANNEWGTYSREVTKDRFVGYNSTGGAIMGKETDTETIESSRPRASRFIESEISYSDLINKYFLFLNKDLIAKRKKKYSK